MARRLALAAVLLGVALLAYTFLPASGSGEKAQVAIPSGASLRAISRELKRAGVIRAPWAFELACRLTGRGRKLKAGDYEVPRDLSAWGVAAWLTSEKALAQRFLIPEGLSASQIASQLEARKLASGARFLKLVHDPAFAKKLGVNAPDLEGWLFPDSYFFARGTPEATLVSMMVTRFKEAVPASLLSEGARLNLKPRQVLSLAALIEKEARSDADRPKVARVFLNRKAKKMRLESCASVRFALNKYTGPVLFKDLDVASPYNTYRHGGLPPGPICSPGLKSIQAAVRPAEGNWLFFVVAGDGTHVFSDTFEDHKKAKARYKRLRRGVVED